MSSDKAWLDFLTELRSVSGVPLQPYQTQLIRGLKEYDELPNPNEMDPPIEAKPRENRSTMTWGGKPLHKLSRSEVQAMIAERKRNWK